MLRLTQQVFKFLLLKIICGVCSIMAKKKEYQAVNEDLKQELLGRFNKERFGLHNRELTVMTRLSAEDVKVLDALVELEVFKSRSEAVAFFVRRMILAREQEFKKLTALVDEIKRRKSMAITTLIKAIEAEKEDDEENEESES